MKDCSVCRTARPLSAFFADQKGVGGRSASCRDCANRKQRTKEAAARAADPMGTAAKRMWRNARTRARRDGYAFTLAVEDIICPEVCPVLGLPLCYLHTRVCDDSPSLDKLDPALGYVPGNAVVMSMLANKIKTSATPEQVLAVALWLRGDK